MSTKLIYNNIDAVFIPKEVSIECGYKSIQNFNSNIEFKEGDIYVKNVLCKHIQVYAFNKGTRILFMVNGKTSPMYTAGIDTPITTLLKMFGKEIKNTDSEEESDEPNYITLSKEMVIIIHKLIIGRKSIDRFDAEESNLECTDKTLLYYNKNIRWNDGHIYFNNILCNEICIYEIQSGGWRICFVSKTKLLGSLAFPINDVDDSQDFLDIFGKSKYLPGYYTPLYYKDAANNENNTVEALIQLKEMVEPLVKEKEKEPLVKELDISGMSSSEKSQISQIINSYRKRKAIDLGFMENEIKDIDFSTSKRMKFSE
jgi:CxxC motif-containing protein